MFNIDFKFNSFKHFVASFLTKIKNNIFLSLTVLYIVLCIISVPLQYKTYQIEAEQYYLTKSQQATFDWIIPLAKSLQKDSGILPSITIAQKVLEQGWDWKDQTIETKCHNYFGMKAGSSWTGKTWSSGTHEESSSGRIYSTRATWRCYDSDEEGFKGRGVFLWTDRYKKFIQYCLKHDYKNAMRALKAAGYMTSSSYVNNAINFIEKYNLTQYDNDPNYQWDGTPPEDATYDGSFSTSNMPLKKPKVTDLDLTTSFTGNYKKGYLYSRFAKTLLEIDLDNEERLDKKENYIIKDIYKRAINYEWANNGSKNAEDSESSLPADSGDWTTWRQGDPKWKSIPLGTGSTIGRAGCLATSIAIQIKRSGTPTPKISNFNPGTFVQYLNKHGGFDGANFVWNSPFTSGAAPGFKNEFTHHYLKFKGPALVKRIKAELDRGCYMVMRVKYGKGQHWVAITNAGGGVIQMVDPASNETDVFKKYPIVKNYGHVDYACYRVTK